MNQDISPIYSYPMNPKTIVNPQVNNNNLGLAQGQPVNMLNNFQGANHLTVPNCPINGFPLNNNCGFQNNNQINMRNMNNFSNNINNNNANRILNEYSNLSPQEKENLRKLINEEKVNSTQNTYNIIEEEEKAENDEYNEKLLEQKLLDKRMLDQQLDYKDCWDFYYSAIATIENIALGNSSKKEYGNWDEFDACSFKNKNDLVIQFLKILKSFKGAYEDYQNDYEGIIDYPEDFNITIKKLEKWKSKINDKNIGIYIDELINIINNRGGKVDIQKELNKYYGNNKIDKDCMRKGFEATIKCGNAVRKEEEKLQKEFEEKGKLNYEVKLNVPAGKLKNGKNNNKI